jgi:hypothetical protein
MQNSVEISKIVDDVSYIISSKLRDALMPVVQSQNTTESAILNLPFVQKIASENRELKIKNAELETKLAIVRENYKRLFLSKVADDVVVSKHQQMSCDTTESKEENNINLEIEEFNINKQDYDTVSVSNLEKEIIELNKPNMVSDEDDTDEETGISITSSDKENEDEEDDEQDNQTKLKFLVTNNPELCKNALENYKLFHKMKTTPSIEVVFNSAAGIEGWGKATLNVNKQQTNETKQEQTVVEEKQAEEEEVEEEEVEQEEDDDEEEV